MSASFPPETPFALGSFDQAPPFQPPFPERPRSRGGNWILGLLLAGLGVLMLGGVVCVAGIWYVAANVDRWLVGLGREAIVAMVEEAEIPAAEKKEVVAQVDRVVTAYKERKIDQDDLQQALTKLEDAPALKVLTLYGLDDVYFNDAGLSADELAAGRRNFARALRGVYEGKFTEDELYAVFPEEAAFDQGQNQDANSAPAGQPITLVADAAQQSVDVDDVRESLFKLKVMVDNARIPDEPFELDIGDEVKKIVDELLAGK